MSVSFCRAHKEEIPSPGILVGSSPFPKRNRVQSRTMRTHIADFGPISDPFLSLQLVLARYVAVSKWFRVADEQQKGSIIFIFLREEKKRGFKIISENEQMPKAKAKPKRPELSICKIPRNLGPRQDISGYWILRQGQGRLF